MGNQMDAGREIDTAVRLEVYRFFVDRGRPRSGRKSPRH